MDQTLILVISIACLFLLLAIGSWIFVSLSLAGVLALFLLGGHQSIIALLSWGAADSWILAAVPLFIFMGNIMLVSGSADDLYTGVSTWLSPLPGGLIHTNIGACAIFAALSGSSTATTATIGSVAIPQQEKRGYDRNLIMGSIAGAGTLGILIPPSINMIIYGAWVEVSIARLFMGGVIPGIILAMGFMVYVAYAAVRAPWRAPRGGRPTPKEMLLSIKLLLPIIIMVAVILGGVYTGWITPTETAAVGCFLAFVIAVLHRKLSWKLLSSAAEKTIVTTSMILIIFVGAHILAHALLRLGITAALQSFIAGSEFPQWLIILLIYFMYIILGCFFDGISMIVITLPIVEPILTGLGIDFIWFGVILILLTEVGMLTPPVGFNLYVMLGIVKDSTIVEVVRSIWPFLVILLLGIALFTVFPQLVLWLPGTMH